MDQALDQLQRLTADQVAQLHVGLLLALAFVLVLGFATERLAPRARGLVTLLIVLLTVASVGAYTRFGRMHSRGTLVHGYEQFHFFFGSKYLEEVRYDGLYPVSLLAWKEQGRKDRPEEARDIPRYEVVPIEDMAALGEEVRERFDDQRWQAFLADQEAGRKAWRISPKKLMVDFSNTGSPAWATVALLFTGTITLSEGGARLLGLIDPALLALLFLGAWRVLNLRAACLALCSALLAVRAFSYLGGSILRLDWFFAIGTAALMLARGRHRVAGLLLGYAIASKPFCALFALALGFHMIGRALRERRLPRDAVETVLAAVLGLGGAIALSSAVFGGPEIWADYWERVQKILHAGYYKGQYSLRDVGYQLGKVGPEALLDPAPRRVWASRNLEPDSMQTGLLWGLRAVLVTGLGLVAARRDQVTAIGIGGLLIFTLLVSNIYYWQLLGLVAMGWAARAHLEGRALAVVVAILLFQASTWWQLLAEVPVQLQGYQGSLGMLVVVVVVLVAGLWPGGRGR